MPTKDEEAVALAQKHYLVEPASQSIRSFCKGQAPHRAPSGQNRLGSFYSLVRGPTSCSTYRSSHPRRQRFQATSFNPNSLRARRKSALLLKKEIHHV